MGREIRRVPPDWEHPRYKPGERSDSYGADFVGRYKPLYDEDFETAITRWWQDANAWAEALKRGETPEFWFPDDDQEATWARANPLKAYAEWNATPPDPATYRNRFTTQPTAYQIYDTVSEGTPISPVFQTEDDLLAWCQRSHAEADARGQKRTYWNALSVEAARRFIQAGSAPSLVFSPEFGVAEGAQAFEHVGKPDDEG